MYYIYQLQNRLNGKRYIGYTTQLPKDRWIDHKYYALNHKRKSRFYSAIQKYGPESFKLTILCEGEDHYAGLNIAEPLMIELFIPEYNMTKGGDGLVDPSLEVRKRMSDSGKKRTDRPFLGRKHTKESKILIGDGMRDYLKTNAPYWSGRKHSTETKQKMAQAKLGNQNRLGKRM